MNGYMGKILSIDLTKGIIASEELNQKLCDLFLGGAGYAAAYLFNEISQKTDPLSPENVLMFMTGPLTGTLAPNTSRMVACAKSPMSGLWGESNCGGTFAMTLKKAGWDGIIIRGKAKSPVYIEIIDDKVQIKPADTVWGKGIYETHKILKSSVQGIEANKLVVAAIGPAGERLVKYSIIGSEERAFGRTGMGAVMGSKNLKAIILTGSGKVSKANEEEFKQHNKDTINFLKEVFTNQMFRDLGTSGGVDMYNESGELPVKYWKQGSFAEAGNISGSSLKETFLKKNRHCGSCVIGCGRVVQIDKYEDVPKDLIEGPEYETIASFGSMMLNGNLADIIKANYLCNDLGLDTISTGSTIAFLMDLYEQKKITKEIMDGLDLKWGNMEAVFTLIKQIAWREGFGNEAAEGSMYLGKKYLIPPDEIAAIKNIEVTYHDPRSSYGMLLCYSLSPLGPNHNACDMYMVSLGQNFPELEIESVDPKSNEYEMAVAAARLHDYRALYSSLIMCVFCNPEAPAIAKYLTLTLGKEFTIEDIKKIGERDFYIKHLFNLKMGFTLKNVHYPKMMLNVLEGSGHGGKVPDADALLTHYYKYRGWNLETGLPDQQKIKELMLQEYVSKIH